MLVSVNIDLYCALLTLNLHMIIDIMESYKLQSGGRMPAIGYGTFLVSSLKLILIE